MNNFDKSIEFWTNGLGLKFEDDCLVKPSPIAHMSAEFDIKKSDEKQCVLDFDGVTCLAFFVKDITQARESLAGFNVEISDNINIEVNGKELAIIMVKGPSGEMVELIQLS